MKKTSKNDYELLYLQEQGDEEAKKILLDNYKPIIITIARNYYNKLPNTNGFDLDDFIQEGYIAFNRAISTYDSSKNVLFYTYACLCIKRGLSSCSLKYRHRPFEYSYDVCDSNIDKTYGDIILSTEKEEILNTVIMNDILYRIIDFKNKLIPDAALVFELRYNGFTYKEIGILLDFEQSKVDRLLMSVKRKINIMGLRNYYNFSC